MNLQEASKKASVELGYIVRISFDGDFVCKPLDPTLKAGVADSLPMAVQDCREKNVLTTKKDDRCVST